jgi:DNA-binding NtrC family response regulator
MAASQKTTITSQGTATGADGDTSSIALTVLYHPHLERVGDRAVLDGLSSRGVALLSRMEPLFSPPDHAEGEPLLEEHLSRKPLRFIAREGGDVWLEIGDSAMAVMVRGRRVRSSIGFTGEQIREGVVIELGRRVVLLLHTVSLLDDVLGEVDAPNATRELAGASEGIRRVLLEIRNVADLMLPVLLRGETGSGKELVARAIHQASPRHKQPFVAVNLGAVSPGLSAAALFGAEPGAYTGSVKRQAGYFEQARGGTLFLDEIGNAPIELQVALLRALETGETQTVGAQPVRNIDVRIIAATDADLEENAARGTFRWPLLHRISSYDIWLPPLRERRDDIGRLLVRFLREELDRIGESRRLRPPEPGEAPWLPSSIVARLADYEWPGNVRELRTVVQKLVIGNRRRRSAKMTPAVKAQLYQQVRATAQPRPPAPPAQPASGAETDASPGTKIPVEDTSHEHLPARRMPADVSEEELRRALDVSRWNLTEAAERLNISRSNIYNLIERSPDLRVAGDVRPEEIINSYRKHAGNRARMVEDLKISEQALIRRMRELGLE